MYLKVTTWGPWWITELRELCIHIIFLENIMAFLLTNSCHFHQQKTVLLGRIAEGIQLTRHNHGLTTSPCPTPLAEMQCLQDLWYDTRRSVSGYSTTLHSYFQSLLKKFYYYVTLVFPSAMTYLGLMVHRTLLKENEMWYY